MINIEEYGIKDIRKDARKDIRKDSKTKADYLLDLYPNFNSPEFEGIKNAAGYLYSMKSIKA